MDSLDAGTVMDIGSPRNPPVKCHKTFYFAHDPMVVLLVGNRLFRVHRYFLIRESQVFRDMFSVPNQQGTETEGMDDEHPIPLPEVKVKEFELLIQCLYGLSPTELPEDGVYSEDEEGVLLQGQHEKDLALLGVAHRFAFDKIFEDLVQRIKPAKIPITKRIRLGDKYNLDKWFTSAFQEMLNREESLSMGELNALGSDRVIRFIRERDHIHKERPDVAERATPNANISPQSPPARKGKKHGISTWGSGRWGESGSPNDNLMGEACEVPPFGNNES